MMDGHSAWVVQEWRLPFTSHNLIDKISSHGIQVTDIPLKG